jgi:erythromycin esterase-like protein
MMQRLRDRFSPTSTEVTPALVDRLREAARPLGNPADLDPLMERIGDAHYVLLGEASHGTSEYYTWRARLSRRLIEEKGFSFIAVEGDWPDCYRVNRYVKGWPDSGTSAREVLDAYERWPTWMWANEEIVELAEWLRGYNNRRLEGEKVGFYGIDVYSLWDSLDAVSSYLERVDPAAAEAARQAYACFEPYWEDEQQYALATTSLVPKSCEDEAVAMLRELCERASTCREEDPEAFFNAEQNALVAKNAELYYRTMVGGGSASWNIRDTHMTDTLDRLMQHHGPDSRCVVWEHNTHIGDARATDMSSEGMVNVGQLVRERHGVEDVVLVGFASHRGSVIAGRHWGAQMERMQAPPARTGSYEDALHAAGEDDKLLIFSEVADLGPLLDPRGHRAIGVVYHPDRERYGNYVPSVLPLRYDALLYLDETHALHPLHLEPEPTGEAQTFPTGV